MIQKRHFALGFGCSTRATEEEILRLIYATLPTLPPDTLLATVEDRADLAQHIARTLSFELKLFPASVLATIEGTTIQSEAAAAALQTSSVAEASALAALGPAARLMVPRQTGRFCTCALAMVLEPRA